ncbi:hypothetical protein OO013_04785 [Mangrovivirga sp. M17]|uniref:DUF4468 domain-containing protein n=1 Tax=Mangrovivirga halotolerans TaxID=2993936 RepID=A0ABT3RPI0_9BACT|nr:hypothetical protein [Mangrovivirga halotolerans]MCX2743167.1 hypothetical protein [Mangrovivirga halotolerans]
MKRFFLTVFLFFIFNISFAQDNPPNLIKKSTIEYINSITDEIKYVVTSSDPDADPYSYSEDSLKMIYHENIDSLMFAIYASASEIDENGVVVDDIIYVSVQETPLLWLKDVEINANKITLKMVDPEVYEGEYYTYYILLFLDSNEMANRLADIYNDMADRVNQYLKAREDKTSCDPPE